jgi:hypothetical protein
MKLLRGLGRVLLWDAWAFVALLVYFAFGVTWLR